jgi:hypothetical protein
MPPATRSGTDAAGPFNFDGRWGTAWKDTDIDADGNIYSREGQQIIKFTRTGPDTFQAPFDDRAMILTGFDSTGPADGDNNIGREPRGHRGLQRPDLERPHQHTATMLAEDVFRADGPRRQSAERSTSPTLPSDFLNNAHLRLQL